MGSTAFPDNLASKIKAKKDCLETAKKILWAEGCSKSSNIGSRDDEESRALVDALTNLHDSLRGVLSEESLWDGSESPSPTSLSPMEKIYSRFHRVRLSLVPDNRNVPTTAVPDGIRDLLRLEADLYRALCLCCLILVSTIDALNLDRSGRKRSRRELENSTSDTLQSKTVVLQATIRQCQFLVRLLDEMELREESKGSRTDQDIPGSQVPKKNLWDDRILEWTNSDCDDDEDENSLNILSFTKEELEREENELLAMAETPIPSTYNERQRPVIDEERNKVLKGRLLTDASGSSLDSVSVQLEERGVLRAGKKDPVDGDSINHNDGDTPGPWSLTSESVVICNDDESPNSIQISNVISFRTCDLTTILLEVGRDGKLWRDQVSQIRANTDVHNRSTMREEQEELEKLWPLPEVVDAQTKARKLFLLSHRTAAALT